MEAVLTEHAVLECQSPYDLHVEVRSNCVTLILGPFDFTLGHFLNGSSQDGIVSDLLGGHPLLHLGLQACVKLFQFWIIFAYLRDPLLSLIHISHLLLL